MSADIAPVENPPQVGRVGMRIWPALLLLALIAAACIARPLVTQWTLNLFRLLLAGPLVCVLAIALWWVFASRIAWRDRLLGLGGGLTLFGIALFAADPTMRGMRGLPFIINVLPIAAMTFTTVVVVLASFGSRTATLTALAAAAVALCYWDTLRVGGISGDFKFTFNWRWQQTAEDKFLAAFPGSGHARPAEPGEPLGSVEWPQFRGPNRDGNVSGVVLDAD